MEGARDRRMARFLRDVDEWADAAEPGPERALRRWEAAWAGRLARAEQEGRAPPPRAAELELPRVARDGRRVIDVFRYIDERGGPIVVRKEGRGFVPLGEWTVHLRWTV